MVQRAEMDFPEDFGPVTSERVPLWRIYPICAQIDPLIRPDGIRASGENDCFARKFGRDGAITALLKLEAHRLHPNGGVDTVVRGAMSMLRYVATEDFPAAGIQRGKMIHETGRVSDGYPKDWYIDENGNGKNYDTLDATDRFLILVHEIVTMHPYLLSEVPSICGANDRVVYS